MAKPYAKPALAVLVACSLFGAPDALAAKTSWDVAPEMKSKVKRFIKMSPVLQDMRFHKVPNSYVFATNEPKGRMMPVYEFIACLSLTNDGVEMDVDFGDELDIGLYGVSFPGGTWDVQLRLREVEHFEFTDKETAYVVDRLAIGTLQFKNHKKKMRAVRQLTSTCFGGA